MTETEEPRYLPWGTVTPQFWDRNSDRHAGAGEQPHVQDEQHATSQPSPPSVPPSPPRSAAESAAEVPDGEAEVSSRPLGDTPTTVAEPANEQVPPAFRTQIEAIDAAILQRRLDEAASRAASVDKQITAIYGPGHLYTVNARELRGFIAHLSGDDITGCRWYLHTVGLRIQSFGTEDPGTRAAAREAAALWQRIQNPQELHRLGTEIIQVLTLVEGADSRSVRATRTRLARADHNPPVDPQRPPDSSRII
jgi:hypothetical protein